MTRIAKPEFGRRHYLPAPVPQLEDEDAPFDWRQRIDWPVVALVAVVFLICFVWLF
jgi:hypothetical protein